MIMMSIAKIQAKTVHSLNNYCKPITFIVLMNFFASFKLIPLIVPPYEIS
jgi:hypothetical protein